MLDGVVTCMDANAPQFIDVFSGAGGLSLGLMKAGWRGLFAIEKSPMAFQTLKIMQFVAEHLTSEEAAKLLGVNKLTIQKWGRIGRLVDACVSGPNVNDCHAYLFNKERLIQWRNERPTFGEAIQLLGVSAATLHRWVIEDKIEPLEDMGGKQRWFSKQAIQELGMNLVR